MSVRTTRAFLLPLALGLGAAGCAEGLPLEELVISTRPLALRVEVDDPAAAMDAPVRAEALPFERIRAVPFIVDPEGPLSPDEITQTVEPVWIQCVLQPIEGIFACLSDATPLDRADLADCPPLDFGAIDPEAELPEVPSPCLVTEGIPSQPELAIPFDVAFLIGGDIELTMVGHVPGKSSTEDCLNTVLAGNSSEDCIVSVGRVAVGPDAELLRLASTFGIPGLEGLGAVPDEVPDADTHPRIQSFVVRVFDANDNEVGTFTPARGEAIEAQIDDRIHVEVLTLEEELQTYLTPLDQDSFEERDETLDGRWFMTWGSLLSPTSDDLLSLNSWTLRKGEQDDDEQPPGNRATLFYTHRDNRQGVDWWWFHVDIVE